MIACIGCMLMMLVMLGIPVALSVGLVGIVIAWNGRRRSRKYADHTRTDHDPDNPYSVTHN